MYLVMVKHILLKKHHYFPELILLETNPAVWENENNENKEGV